MIHGHGFGLEILDLSFISFRIDNHKFPWKNASFMPRRASLRFYYFLCGFIIVQKMKVDTIFISQNSFRKPNKMG